MQKCPYCGCKCVNHFVHDDHTAYWYACGSSSFKYKDSEPSSQSQACKAWSRK